jgi:hypothetical protein
MKYLLSAWNGFIWIRIESHLGALVDRLMNFLDYLSYYQVLKNDSDPCG